MAAATSLVSRAFGRDLPPTTTARERIVWEPPEAAGPAMDPEELVPIPEVARETWAVMDPVAGRVVEADWDRPAAEPAGLAAAAAADSDRALTEEAADLDRQQTHRSLRLQLRRQFRQQLPHQPQ